MNRVTDIAEECNIIPTANNKNAAFIESVSDGNISNSGGEEQKKKVHSFSKKLAKEIQAKKRKLNPKAKNASHETTLLKYLANRVHASKNIIDGKRWFYTTVEKLAEQFPYFGNTTAYDLSVSLEKLGCLEIGNFNRYKYDRTLWFHVPKAICHAAEEDLVYFDAAIAEDVGIVGAVLQRNFEYWIGQLKEKGEALHVKMSPAILAELLPFSERTIKRGLKSLEGKYMNKLSENEPIYGIIQINRGPYPNEIGSNPNDRGPYPNNDTYWKPINNLLENSSKKTLRV